MELSSQALDVIERGASWDITAIKFSRAGGPGFVAFLTSPLAAKKIEREIWD